MNFLLRFITGGGLKGLTGQITEWDLKRRDAANDADRIAAETMIDHLKLRQQVLVEETKHGATRWIRPAFASIALVYWAKLVVYDTILGWGSTPYPGDHVAWFVTLIPGAYFLTRPLEKWRR
jgi:hypothetical protein